MPRSNSETTLIGINLFEFISYYKVEIATQTNVVQCTQTKVRERETNNEKKKRRNQKRQVTNSSSGFNVMKACQPYTHLYFFMGWNFMWLILSLSYARDSNRKLSLKCITSWRHKGNNSNNNNRTISGKIQPTTERREGRKKKNLTSVHCSFTFRFFSSSCFFVEYDMPQHSAHYIYYTINDWRSPNTSEPRERKRETERTQNIQPHKTHARILHAKSLLEQ